MSWTIFRWHQANISPGHLYITLQHCWNDTELCAAGRQLRRMVGKMPTNLYIKEFPVPKVWIARSPNFWFWPKTNVVLQLRIKTLKKAAIKISQSTGEVKYFMKLSHLSMMRCNQHQGFIPGLCNFTTNSTPPTRRPCLFQQVIDRQGRGNDRKVLVTNSHFGQLFHESSKISRIK